MRKLLTLLMLFLVTIGLMSSSVSASDSSFTYLPLVIRAVNTWLGPDGGRPVCLAVDPSNPAIVYAGSWGAGMFKSLDGGTTWFQTNSGLENMYINSLAIDPNQPSVLYAGTYRSQVYKSTDGGQTWFWSGTGIQEAAIVYTIAIDPTNTANLFIGTRGISNNGQAPWNGVLYRSSDGGASWMAVLQNVGGITAQDWVYSLAVNPQAPNNVYAATHEHGVYRSTNYGGYFFPSNEGVTDLSSRAIVVDYQAPSPYTLYMGVWKEDGVYRSVDGGGEWGITNDGIRFIPIYGMTMDPLNPKTIYLSTFSQGILRTVDGGEVWLGRGLITDDIYTVAINPQNTSTLYAGTAGDGLYRSLDGGLTWQHSQAGFLNSDVASTLAPTTSEHLFAGLIGGGVLESLDGGRNWIEINTGLTDKFIVQLVADPLHPNLLYALTQSGGLFRNDTSGSLGWVFVGEDLPLSTNTLPAYSIDNPLASRETLLNEINPTTNNEGLPEVENLLSMVFAPSNPAVVYLGTGGSGIYKSLNGGRDWFFSGLEGLVISSVAVDPLDARTVYAVTNGSGYVRASYDGGGSWQTLTMYAPAVYVVAVASDGSGDLYLGTNLGVLRYTPATGWTSAGLSGISVPVLSTDPQHPGAIFAGTADGVYYSTDDGATWQYGPAELDGLTVQSIGNDPLNSQVFYFGTKTHGILRAYVDLTDR